jgi:hypothetical protein
MKFGFDFDGRGKIDDAAPVEFDLSNQFPSKLENKRYFARSGVSFSPLSSKALRSAPLDLASVMNLVA